MPSQINSLVPADNGSLVSKEIRDNFAAAKSEIEALQNNPASLDFSESGAMRFGGATGVATEFITTDDGRELLTLSLSEQKIRLGVPGDIIFGPILGESADFIMGQIV